MAGGVAKFTNIRYVSIGEASCSILFPFICQMLGCQIPEVQIRKGTKAVMNEYEGDQIDFNVAIWLNRVPI